MAITYPARLVRFLMATAALGWSYARSQEPLPGMLQPRESETREIRSLDGLWNFRLCPTEDPLLGFRQKWYERPLSETGPVIPMPVPASYNDITQDKAIRDHVGLVWYDKLFYVPARWNNSNDDCDGEDSTLKTKVWLRFGGVHYAAKVYLNGLIAMQHEIGHLPFEGVISDLLIYGGENRVTVVCDNTLLQDSIPQGNVAEQTGSDLGTVYIQSYSFDFFNYAGIDRPVLLYTTPSIYISDVDLSTNFDRSSGIINYEIHYSGAQDNETEVSCSLELYDKSGRLVLTDDAADFTGKLDVPNAQLWWPYLMHDQPGYMYTLKISLSTPTQQNIDVYRQPVGIRTITWSNTSLLVNNREVYLRGFGRHEDSDIRGKGLDLPLVAKDYNLIKWIGANAYRTSHYPYAEEIMDRADEEGIMIIDECPSVDTENFSSKLLLKHKQSLSELIRRDKNRPAVIMWSIANEPRTQLNGAGEYFGAVADHVRSLDNSRPITIAIAQSVTQDKVGQHLDIISFNRYNAWYSNAGRLDMITEQVYTEARSWHQKYQKPVIMSEYGADTIEGLHLEPDFVWTEEYQVELMSNHFKAFDRLRHESFFIGEFIWNFADFKTAQTVMRVGGNKKGIFTRQRQPKASAHHLRARYSLLAEQLDGRPVPTDTFQYVINSPHKTFDEL